MTGSDIQVEHGEFTRIHNTILERLALARLSGSEYRCLLYLLRKTYGYGKKEDRIGLTQWEKGTGIKRQNVWLVLQELREKRIVYMVDNGPKRAQTWGFNKYFEQWQIDDDGGTVMVEHDSFVMPRHDRLEPSVMPQHDSSVMVEHDSLEPSENQSVMVEHDKTVMLYHDNKRKKERSDTNVSAANAGTAPKHSAREPTGHQQYFAKVCEIVGWDYKTLTKDQKGQVAQTVGVLSEAGYSLDELSRFGKEIWVHDWRWQKHRQHPTLSQLRAEIGKLRSGVYVNGDSPVASGRVDISVGEL